MNRLFHYLKSLKWKYLFSKSVVRVNKDSTLYISPSARLKNVSIILVGKSNLLIQSNCCLSNVSIYVCNGTFVVHEHAQLIGGCAEIHKSSYIINEGSFLLNRYSKLGLRRLWIRFGGKVSIGSYTNINENSEIRSDESIQIGSYNQISYQVNIWDTNTHNIYSEEKRRAITEKYYPYFGYEYEKPKTKPIIIGDNCWIGEKASILKGSILEDNVIVGYNTMISNKKIPRGNTVVQDVNLKIFEHE